MQGISRVFNHVKGRCVLGYKQLFCAFFDGKTTKPLIFHYIRKREEAKQQLGLKNYQSCDFNNHIADSTLCYLTYTVMALEKRFTEYQTMDELFSDMEDDLMALMLWKRVLAYMSAFFAFQEKRLG